MIDATILDDARDALALIRACLDDDADAAMAITDNCDQLGVIHILAGIAAQGLVCHEGGETGARRWLDRKAAEAAGGN